MSNRSLETLGDSILGFIVTSYLFQTYPTALEGEITTRKTEIVSNRRLVAVSCQERLDLDSILLGISSINGLDTLRAGAVEALIGAIFMDQGIQAATEFVHANIISYAALNPVKDISNPISTLQRRVHQFMPGSDVTYVKHKSGHVSAKVGSKVLAKEKRSSYKLSRAAAALTALNLLKDRKS